MAVAQTTDGLSRRGDIHNPGEGGKVHFTWPVPTSLFDAPPERPVLLFARAYGSFCSSPLSTVPKFTIGGGICCDHDCKSSIIDDY